MILFIEIIFFYFEKTAFFEDNFSLFSQGFMFALFLVNIELKFERNWISLIFCSFYILIRFSYERHN